MKTLPLKGKSATSLPAGPREKPIVDTATNTSTTSQAQAREVYFDFNRGNYWTRNERGGWIMMNETQIKRVLRASGISPNRPDGCHVSPLDERLLEIQGKMDVHYAGPLAGYQAGALMAGEKRALVTESPRLVAPAPGEWPTLHQLIEGLLVSDECDQRHYFYGWVKVAVEALAKGSIRPGQALALCGPHDCGKSLLQNLLTVLLGGRSAKPYQFMSGQTTFNADLFEAEHLQIEDDQSSTDIRARRNFGTSIKAFCVNQSHRLHDKGRRAVNDLRPFWRVTITVNDEPENLMVLPPLDDSLADKLLLLRAFKRLMPMPTDSDAERAAFWARLVSELPAFVHFLTTWTIPDELRSSRFGVTHYHHPALVAAIDSLAPEQKLLGLLDGELFTSPAAGAWHGTAAELESLLTGANSRCAYEARKLLSWPTACGVYLARLAKRMPERITHDRDADSRRWTIHPTR
jgi:energy-coupling factor transporter ATP-binding protein EcfA2